MIAALAGSQGGAVARDQLIALGFGAAAIDHRLRCGKLHVVFRGVYAVGHRLLRREGAWWAAVLAGSEGTLLSHVNGAAAWDLRPDPAGPIHITVPDRRRVRQPGLIVHRPRTLTPGDARTCGGIPITSVARTLFDLAGSGMRERALAAALDRAEFLRLLDFAELRELIERHPTRRGAPALASLLSGYSGGATVTRSELEDRFLALCRSFGLPRPKVNAVIEGREVDFVWPLARLIVEVDGYAYHRSPTAFATDRERDVELVLAGYRVLRFTWEQVTRRPSYVARSVRRAFGVI